MTGEQQSTHVLISNPAGVVAVWPSSSASIPTGWTLRDATDEHPGGRERMTDEKQGLVLASNVYRLRRIVEDRGNGTDRLPVRGGVRTVTYEAESPADARRRATGVRWPDEISMEMLRDVTPPEHMTLTLTEYRRYA